MSSSKRPFVVPFIGLKAGKHNFNFELTKTFFEDQGYDEFFAADVQVDIELEKKETMLIVNFVVKGAVEIPCDRCTDGVESNLDSSYRWVYKFGTEESGDENLIVLHPDTYEIDFADALYELTIVSLPNKISHEEGDCDEDMVKMVEQYVVNHDDDDEEELDEDEEDEDPRSPWDILKDLN